MSQLGVSGRLAAAFITSKLTPLMMVTTLLLGIGAVVITPREEEPQIIVPMADVWLPFPGASAKVVEEQITRPIERKLSEIKTVEYLYSISRPGGALIIVRFYVGEQMERSLVDLYDKLMAHQDLLPTAGTTSPAFMVKPRDINDVPIITLTLTSERYSDFELRRVAHQVLEDIKSIPGTAGGFVVGGRPRELRVALDPTRLKAYGFTPHHLAQAIQRENMALPAGRLDARNQSIVVEGGRFIRSKDDLDDLVVGVAAGRPVYLRQVADVVDGPAEAEQYVWFRDRARTPPDTPAVTVAIAKQAGVSAAAVADDILSRVEALTGHLIPSDLHVAVTRDYGETANEKANELLWHLAIAVIAVVAFLSVALGGRPAMVVSVAIPLTLALTLFASMLIGYTLNRVTLFALIFSIGILVDDAIVVVENIYRHLRLARRPHREAAIHAVDEVGNPTILATLTVIAALLPMAFVSGLMGPYMRPIPVNASIAMLASLLVAFAIIPWFCQTCYRSAASVKGLDHEEAAGGWTDRFFQRAVAPLLARPVIAYGVLVGIALLLVASMALFYTRSVVVKMLPFDNKSELQVVIDMPEGTTLEETARVTRALTDVVGTLPELANYQAYVGVASPFNFNGLVRHYFLRDQPHQADIQINLLPKGQRRAQSHQIAQRIRPQVQAVGRQYGANVKVVEVPPGPPVQSVLVAEVYGPTYAGQQSLAEDIRSLFDATAGIVDVDTSIEADQPKYVLLVDRPKAALAGISSDHIVTTLQTAIGGLSVGLVHIPEEKTPVPIRLRLPLAERTDLEQIGELAMQASNGTLIALSELLRPEERHEDKAIYHKNQQPVVYVLGDVGGSRAESPVYGVLDIGRALDAYRTADGRVIEQYYTGPPPSDRTLSVTWDGEWRITYETFRDMGLAFAVAMVLIYLLIVAQFQSFLTPIIIMAPIPLTLIGILPGHWLTGSYFTATSMIGFIALAGIIVRNSILLVDFIQLEQRRGVPLRDAVIRAGAIRTRPILLTAAALMVGAFVIILDPIFQGLAVSLLFGVGASTLLTLVVIPVLYYTLVADSAGEAAGSDSGDGAPPHGTSAPPLDDVAIHQPSIR